MYVHIYIYIYKTLILLTFVCAASSLVHDGFLPLQSGAALQLWRGASAWQWLLLLWAWALVCWEATNCAHGLSVCGTRPSSSSSSECLWEEIQPMSSALAGRCFTSGLQGSPYLHILHIFSYIYGKLNLWAYSPLNLFV